MTYLQKCILTVIIMLLSVGFVMVYSTSTIVSAEDSATGNAYFFIKKQLIWIVLGFLAMIFCMDTDYHLLARYSGYIYGVALLLVLLVLIPGIGVKYNGARRWIRIAGFGLQPSDFMKIAMVIWVSHYADKHYKHLSRFFIGFLPIFSTLVFTCFIIVLEPDFGTACFILFVNIMLLFISGIKLKHLFPVFILCLPAIIFLAIFKLHHIYARINIYLNPELDPLGKGFQIRQSLIALGSGGFSGLGLGWSRQKLFFLSEESTDFIFAILGEELGWIGTLCVIILYICFLYYGCCVAKNAFDVFGSVLAYGITLLVGVQAIFNMAVVTHSIPAKGISLPLISFGGSNLFFTMAGIGILLNIAGSESAHEQK